MASLISGYEYDIFISYRQKDNKGDKWVSRFVDALKTELEATFKEDISVYFDENPHDRLQETHNVDKSLEGKMKCLIFIPILSQTYCDPNSYAWQYELLSFLKLAGEDSFGKDIKLRSGNVASRILPIRIHDLEPEDVKLFEKETGSVLRAMDFVFKTSTGVIRPLLPNEDHPNDNLNKTFYRDQISKVTLAIKEIILAMKKEPEKVVKENEKAKEVRTEEKKIIPESPPKSGKRKYISIVAIMAMLVIIAILAYPKIFKRDSLEKLRSSGERISVAVMPFQNKTNDTIWNDWQDGIQDELINYLTAYNKELDVKQTGSINGILKSQGFDDYSSLTPAFARAISKDLNANIFIFGNIRQAGDKIRVNAQVIDSKTEEVLEPFIVEYPADVDTIFYVIDSLSEMVKDFLIISKLRIAGPSEFEFYSSTSSPEAYKYYRYGNNAYGIGDFPKAAAWYQQAIDRDSNFTAAINMLSALYFSMGLYKEGKELCKRNYRRIEHLPLRMRLYVNYFYAVYFQTPEEEIKYFRQVLDYDDQVPSDHFILGFSYNKIHQFDNAIREFKTALDIYKKWGTKVFGFYNYTELGIAYHETGKYKEEQELYRKAEQDFPNDRNIVSRQAILSLSQGDTVSGRKYIDKYIKILKDNSEREISIIENLAGIYSEAGVLDKAEEYYNKALSLEPQNPKQINNLAYFLIDNNKIITGLLLVEKALELSPDNYIYLHTKGWGLYKQNKYKDTAYETLDKSWKLRMENAVYNHEAYLHLEAAKKAVADQKRDN